MHKIVMCRYKISTKLNKTEQDASLQANITQPYQNFTSDIRLYAFNNEIYERIFIKFGIDVIPYVTTADTYFLTSCTR
jgi:hypothetical protein